MYERRTEIMQNVFLTYLPASKFKTSVLSAHLAPPLSKETASANALLPAVLRRGTMRCPDMESLSAALDTLYGAQIDYTVRKKGERQCIGFVASVIDDAFAPAGEKLLEPVADLLGELFLDPVTRNGRFLTEYVDSEKQNLIDAIRAIRNDKQDWADVRLMQEMCAGEPYGVLRLGDEESAAKINNHKLFNHYRELLATSRVEMFYCGSAKQERVQGALCRAFAALPRGVVTEGEPIRRIAAPEQPRYLTEEMDVTQGKLSMGWRCGTDDVPAMIMANLIFGGTSNAKLFLNVREKMSLYRDEGLPEGTRRDPASAGAGEAGPVGRLGIAGRTGHHVLVPDLTVRFAGRSGELLSGPDRHRRGGHAGGSDGGAASGDAGAHPEGGSELPA